MLRTLAWWWSLPIACIVLLGYAMIRPDVKRIVLSLAFSIVGTLVLLWAMYAPALFIDL